MTRVGIGLGAVVWTWLWLLPIGGFHHMYRFGLLGWANFDGEAINDAESGGYAFRWSLILLIVSGAVWLGGIALVRLRS